MLKSADSSNIESEIGVLDPPPEITSENEDLPRTPKEREEYRVLTDGGYSGPQTPVEEVVLWGDKMIKPSSLKKKAKRGSSKWITEE